MGYRLDNKDADLSKLRQLTFVPSSKAGDVYRYKNEALRVFRDGEEPIDKKTAEYLTNISTERILLPRKLLFYNNAFKGYTMKLVSQKGAGKRIITTQTDEIIDCVEAVEKDINELSHKKVLLNGINPGYSLYNGELYLVNPAGYRIIELESYEKLAKLNEFQLQLLLTELIASDMRKNRYSQALINSIKKILNKRDLEQSCSSYLKELLNDNRNIKEYVKRIEYK